MNQLTDMQVDTSNILADPVFVDLSGGDWHLSTGTTTAVKFGGRDLSSEFDVLIDKDGNDRTVPWSIGAYELD
jgi:hypothetical protein